MAGRGPAPTGTASRRNKKPKDVVVKSDNKLRGKPLPKGRLGTYVCKDELCEQFADGLHRHEIKWHPSTVEMWEEWRRSPQAVQMMTGPDWSYMLDTALAHHHYWNTGRFELAGEIRQRMAKLGATPEDRKRIGMTIEVPEMTPVGNAVQGTNADELKARRQRMIAQEEERRKQG